MTRTQSTVAVTRRLPKVCEARLEDCHSVRWASDDIAHTPATLLDLVTASDALIVTPSERLEATTINALPARLKVISCFSVGFEHVAIEAAKSRGIIVTNTPGVLTEATADIAWLLILGTARRALEGERLMRSGGWSGWRPTQLMGQQLAGKTLGIFGMGRIGQAVARRAQGFGMNILYHNRRALPDNVACGAVFVESQEELLSKSNVLSLHAPLTPETEGFLNADRLALLPKGAIVINTARGPLIDDDALIAALSAGQIAAAGLDVFTGEPAFDQRYRELENTFLLPHLGSATRETREAMGMMVIDNMEAVLAGKEPLHRVV
jgi:lactate dehydrogenase-like 2-hydroxyacid dehydrogenase